MLGFMFTGKVLLIRMFKRSARGWIIKKLFKFLTSCMKCSWNRFHFYSKDLKKKGLFNINLCIFLLCMLLLGEIQLITLIASRTLWKIYKSFEVFMMKEIINGFFLVKFLDFFKVHQLDLHNKVWIKVYFSLVTSSISVMNGIKTTLYFKV